MNHQQAIKRAIEEMRDIKLDLAIAGTMDIHNVDLKRKIDYMSALINDATKHEHTGQLSPLSAHLIAKLITRH